MTEPCEASDQDLELVTFPFNGKEQKTIQQASEKVSAWLKAGGEVPRVSIALLREVAIFAAHESQAALSRPMPKVLATAYLLPAQAEPEMESTEYWKLMYERTKALLEISEHRLDSRDRTEALEAELLSSQEPVGREALTAETVESMREVWLGFPAGNPSVFTSFMRWAKRVLGITREGM